MARPPIINWSGELFKKQLRAALDWLEVNGGSGNGNPIGGGGSLSFDGGSASGGGSTSFDGGGA